MRRYLSSHRKAGAIAAERRRRRQARDEDAAARRHDQVGNLFGLDETSTTFMPPLVQVGWIDRDDLTRELVCVSCSPAAPSPQHTPVNESSYLATKRCDKCGRRLEDDTRIPCGGDAP